MHQKAACVIFGLGAPLLVNRDRRTRRRVAQLVTEVTYPPIVVVTLLFVVAWRSTPSALQALKWGSAASLFAAVIPSLLILSRLRRREVADHHLSRREHRPLFLAVSTVSMLAGLGLLAWGGAPRALVALGTVLAVGLAISTLVSLVWKMSIQTAVAASTVVTVALMFGPPFLALGGLVGLVGWSRVELDAHTLAQVVVGAALGGAIAAIVLSLLR
jgi:hypothetical protein